MTDRIGTWMQTYTGRRFYPLDARAEDVCIEDIGHATAFTCRFGGHVKRYYSVAQHSVLVSQACAPVDALWGLLHDGAEAYLGDMVRPLKHQYAMHEFCEAETRVLHAIAERFGLPWPIPRSVKRADEELLATECRDVMGGEVAGDWCLTYEPSENVITPWSPQESEHAFLARFHELTAARRAA